MRSERIKHASIALLLSLTGLCTGAAIAQGHGHSKKQLAEDIMDHRTMAEAHRKAADCFEAGKPEKECRAQLAKDCKGVGIGRGCGMKDRHKH
jgi:hypothetical protein